MIRELPEGFTRDEWAYLITFIDERALLAVYQSTFGQRIPSEENPKEEYWIRDSVALWLPNNVSLLGPLVMILVSITGSTLRIKVGSRAENLCELFVNWALSKCSPGPLKTWLSEKLTLCTLSRGDKQLNELSLWANVKIAFGSDQGCKAIRDLPSQTNTKQFLFSNKQSRAWSTTDMLDDDTLRTVIKVFTIYGRSGCTSPQSLTLLNETKDSCHELARRLVKLWPTVVKNDVPMHIASNNVLSHQCSLLESWQATLVSRNKAVIAVGESHLPLPSGHLLLPITYSTLENAIETLPENIQTIGHKFNPKQRDRIAEATSETDIKRFVPISDMHHFEPVWDGMEFWKALFCQDRKID